VTNACAWRSPRLLTIPVTKAPGPQTSTNAPAPPARTIHTRCVSSPAPGPASCGAAGSTKRPPTPPCITAPNHTSTPPKRPEFNPEVDTEGVMEVGPHTGQVGYHRDSQCPQMIRRPHTGKHEELGRANSARTEDHFTISADKLGLPVMTVD